MPNPSLNISTVAQKSGSNTIGKADISAADARKALRDMRAQLVGKDGSISSGYLSINTKGDGSINLETRGRHQWGSFHSDKKDATALVKNLIREGYGKHLDEYSESQLIHELDTYLKKTGDRMGTQSFVKLLDRLDRCIDTSAVGQKTEAQFKNDVRFKANFTNKLQTHGCSSEAKPQFDKIIDQVRPETARFFKHLLAPSVSKAAGVGSAAMRTQVVGDADGSVCRTLLSGINSGHIKLQELELKQLAEVMDEEAQASNAYDHRKDFMLEAFQKDQLIASKLDNIVDKAEFKSGKSKLVFIGDILHDRFSNNKQAMEKLIRGLHGQGAVFITGNHDVYEEVNSGDDLLNDDAQTRDRIVAEEKETGQRIAQNKNLPYTDADEEKDLGYANDKFDEFKGIKLQNGFYGARQIKKEASDQLLKDCFKNAHLDQDTSMLYTHNGFQHSGVGNVYMTAFGFIQANNAEELAEKMNARDFNDTTQGFEAIQGEFGEQDFKSQFLEQRNLENLGILKAQSGSEDLVNQDGDANRSNEVKFRKELDKAGIDENGAINKTSFRPKDHKMTTEALGVAGRRANGRAVTVVHGHDDQHGESQNVQNLNARSNQGLLSPISKIY